MIDVLVNLIIICAILGIAWWALSALPLPAPFGIVVRVAFALVAIILLLGVLDVVPSLHLYRYRR